MKSLHLERVLVKDSSKVHVISVEKIDYIETYDDYITIKTKGKTHLNRERMAILKDGTKFLISRARYDKLKGLL
ncbi:MAG: hypothetical protein ABSC53_06160 [Bacteroidota bacterium]|jgi:two-component system LytT family response regulator